MALATSNDTDVEFSEADKLYMTGDVEIDDSIEVVIDTPRARTTSNINIESSYPFEESLFSENAEKLFNENSEKAATVLNNRAKRSIVINQAVYQLLVDFTNAYGETYTTKRVPDLSAYYDLANDARNENKLLVETYAYQQGMIKTSTVLSVDNEIKIKEVNKLAGNVYEVHFYISTICHTDNGDEFSGRYAIAYVVDSMDGAKMLKFWVQDFDFENMQNTIKSEVSSRNARTAGNTLAEKLLNDHEATKDAILTMDAVQDNESVDGFIIDDKANPLLRKTTVSYDRTAVAAAAKKYAKTDNPLFVRESQDCTNYVSQCMWQSPGWKFDKIEKTLL